MSLSITRSSSLLSQINPIYYNRDVPSELVAASQEAQSSALLIGAGTAFGLAGRAIMMAATLRRFSVPSILFYGLVGGIAGAAAAATTIHSFFSNLTNREQILEQYLKKR